MTLLTVDSVVKRFGGVTALGGVSLDIYENEILGLIGPNGSGKTTLVNIVTGVYPPDSGRILFREKDITRLPPHLRFRMGIARTYQITRPFNNLTVLENVMVSILNGRRYGKVSVNEAREIAENILETLGLSSFKETLSKHLNASGRKKLELARALGAEPELMLLDECLAGLTPSEVSEMLNIIRKIKDDKKITILMIEHLMHAVMNISDRVVVFHEGMKIAEGKPQEVTNDVKVVEVYFGDRELALKFVRRREDA